MKEEKSFVVELLKIAGLLALIPVSIYLSAYTLQSLWEWFVVTTFSLPSLTMLQSLGIALTVGYLTKSTDYYVEREGVNKERTINSIAKPLVVLVVGWVIHSCM